eukprot:TRINITY_DN23782_c0_g1_i1.p1 TRINITY_DN23782_c0_g1~~TRINITY_DN23782_c0_g1_i1.p1  ORF type:complete len:190 (-),score=55.34 TRINITY_DN23782_c0_g1_i1:406-975(-)
MQSQPDVDFEVRWYPFQLNSNAPEEPTSKMEAYMKKFGRTKEEVMAMSAQMEGRFKAIGLPYKFTEKSLVSNTFQAHRLMTAAYEHGGPEAQDKAAESLFKSYFGEEMAPTDPKALEAAAAAAGLDAAKFLADRTMAEKETRAEFAKGNEHQVRGVPHFIISSQDGRRPTEVSGAQPPQEFAQIFKQMA